MNTATIPFTNRIDAGKQLAEKLLPYSRERPLILALPRGGVPVGYEVATALRAPLDTVVARKIGVPYSPEYGIGAIAPPDVIIFDDKAVESLGLNKGAIDPIIEQEMEEMQRRINVYQSGVYSNEVSTSTVILVDDGLATGVTARAAIESVKILLKPKNIIFAAPICARDSASDIKDIVDDVVCLCEVEDLVAIGYWYEDFGQTTDEEVIAFLQKANIR